MRIMSRRQRESGGGGILSQLNKLGGLTFFKDYRQPSGLNADYSKGSGTATFTCTRQATNSTYVDDNGVIQLSNTAVNRKNNYYDSTGFHARAGVLLEPAGTNLLIRTDGTASGSGLWTGWDTTAPSTATGTITKSVVAIPELSGITNATSQRLQYTGVVGDSPDKTLAIISTVTGVGTVVNTNVVTFSYWVRSQTGFSGVTFRPRIASYAADGTTFLSNYFIADQVANISTTWRRFSHTVTVTDATSSRVIFGISILTIGNGDTVDFEIAHPQVEINSVATSYIQTAAAAVTRAADAPGTYVDASGVIQVNATNNTPRYQGGYYSATGFTAGNKGLVIEGAITNLVPKSYTMNDATWTATNVTVADGQAADPMGGTNAASLTASNTNGTVILATAVTAQTYSVWIKRKTGTGDVTLTADGTNYGSALSLSSTDWRRFSITAASASQKCGIKIATNTDAIYVFGNQFEASPYATSFIPTTTAAMSRTVEIFSYPTTSNYPTGVASVFVKFAPESAFANDGVSRFIIASGPDTRDMVKITTGTSVRARFNANDSASATATGTTTILTNTSYVAGAVFQHSSPYVNIYTNGTSEATYTSADPTDPAYSPTSIWIGSGSNVGASPLNGIIQAIAVFSDAKDSTAVTAITNAMNS